MLMIRLCMIPLWVVVIIQMMESEPKTVEDYKDVVKILKLKIIKQNKRIQELQAKNKTFEDQLNGFTLRGDDMHLSSRVMADLQHDVNEKREQREAELGTLRGKAEVVGLFARGLRKLGLTPEAVFRVADFAYKNYVQSQYFREVVGKLRVGLSAKEVSCLIFVFDQAYSGFITRDDYINSLSAYKATAENPHPPFLQECAFKLAQLLHGDKVNLLKFYEQMQGKSRQAGRKGIDLNLFAQSVKKNYGGRLCDRQIVGAFNAMDLQAIGALEKSNFLYCLTSQINRLLTGEDNVSRKTQQDWNNPNARSQYVPEPVQHAKTTPKKFQKQNPNQTSKVVVLPYTPTDNALDRLQGEYRISLQSLYEEILLDPLSSRLTMKSFKKHLLALNSQLPSGLLSDLFRDIDSSTKGSIYFSELANYFLAHSNDTDIILRIIGKYLYAHDLDSQKFWFMYGLSPEAEISKAKFLEIMGKTFETKSEKAWEGLWGCFDKGRGTCALAGIIRTFRKYEIE